MNELEVRLVERPTEALDHPDDRDAVALAIRGLIKRIVLSRRDVDRDGRHTPRVPRNQSRVHWRRKRED